MSFTNLYYKRTAGTPKACYVCNKPTTSVLATINTIDFIYACDNHLTDPGFASQLGESNDGVGANGAKSMGLTPEEIAKVKADWEESQKKKQEQAKEKEKEKEDKGSEKAEDEKKRKSKKSPSPTSSSTPTPAPSTTPKHQRYTLHRDIFAMRLAEHRKRRQTAQAKALAPRLPSAPRGSLPSS